MLPFLSFSFPLLFLFLFSFSASTHHDPQSLFAFKNHITADPHASLAHWNPALPFCNWTAVTCSRRHTDRIVSLNLSDMELQGTISPSLANLSFLHTLDLSGNALHGYIPPQLGRLFRLKTLYLDHNRLVGSIPTNLCNSTNLAYLALSDNNLTGSIPRELGSLTHLQELYLGANILTEYGLGGTISSQGDVYSYGILLLEMFTRKRPTSDMFVGDLNLHNWVNFAFPDRLNEVIDSGLLCEVDADEFEKNNAYKCLLSLLRIGLLCSKHSVKERPTMRIVVRMLESIREDLVSNIVPSRGFRRSMSNLLSNTNATSNGAPTSNEQQSSTF